MNETIEQVPLPPLWERLRFSPVFWKFARTFVGCIEGRPFATLPWRVRWRYFSGFCWRVILRPTGRLQGP